MAVRPPLIVRSPQPDKYWLRDGEYSPIEFIEQYCKDDELRRRVQELYFKRFLGQKINPEPDAV